MRNKSSPVSLSLLLVCVFLVEGCWGIPEQGSNEPLPTFNPSPLLPTPTPLLATPTIIAKQGSSQPLPTSSPRRLVNVDHAWQTCMSGGELTYEEVIALRDARMLETDKCRLKETIGWVAWWVNEGRFEYTIFPNKNRVAVYVYDPFYGPGKDITGWPEMDLIYFSDEEVARLTVGQRIKFSGDLVLVDLPGYRDEQVVVSNPKYSLLEDDPPVDEPTADELKDLVIRLDKTRCLRGVCPDYTLTITSDGKVTFEGRHHTRVKGTETTTIDKAKLEELATEIKRVDFFGLLDEYPKLIEGYPTYTISIQMGGKSKTVTAYATEPPNTYTGPRRLWLLQGRIDEIVNSEQWVRCDGACR